MRALHPPQTFTRITITLTHHAPALELAKLFERDEVFNFGNMSNARALDTGHIETVIIKEHTVIRLTNKGERSPC